MAEFIITTKEQLCALTMRTGAYSGGWKDNVFQLNADIDLTGVDPAGDGKGWWPIGWWSSGNFFNGQFCGNGHVISNMTINRPGAYAGFFGTIDPDADGAGYAHDFVADLALTNINIIATDTYAGGMLAYILSPNWTAGYYIRNCYVQGEMTASRIAGGFCGGSNNGPFKNCYTDVKITCVNSRCELGSFLGAGYIGTRVENCYGMGLVNNTGPVTGDTEVGGFVGEAAVSFSGTDCFWDKITTGKDTDGVNGIAIGKTTAQMKQEATFTNWDFTNDWWVTEGVTYPALRVFGGAPAPSGDSVLSFNRSLRGIGFGMNRGII